MDAVQILEENLSKLSEEMKALKKLTREIAEKQAQRMKAQEKFMRENAENMAQQMQLWIGTVKSKEKEFHELQDEIKQMNKDSLKASKQLNKKVIQTLDNLAILRDEGDILEALLGDQTVMENLSDTLDQNLEALATEMIALKYFSCRVVRKEPKRMEGWLESIQSAMTDFDEIRRENELRGDHLNNLSSRVMLNGKVIKSLKAAIALKKDVKAIMESIEPFPNELKTDTPKLKVVNPFKKDTENSLTPLKKVMEASDMKIVKPMHFTPAEVRRFTMNFSNKTGDDYFVEVYKGQFPNGQKIFVTLLKDGNVIDEKLFMTEVNTMFRISHQNLVKLYGFCFHQNIKALVHEYVDNGSLDGILYQNNHGHVGWEKLQEIAIQTATGLLYLHDGFHDHIILGDFSPNNVFLDSDFSPKVKHFGVAKLMNRDETHIAFLRFTGQPGYEAPEMWTPRSRITNKCDVYSFGMMLFEILGRKKNLQREWEPKRIWNMCQNEQLDELVDEWAVGDKNKQKAKLMCMVAFWCIQFTEQIRPPMSTVVKMLKMEIPFTNPPNPFNMYLTSPMY